MPDAAQRILIDATMLQTGGGFTYAVNVVPQLARQAPERRFRVLVRSERLRDSLPELPNLEVEWVPARGLPGRLAFTHFTLPRLARRWGAELLLAAGELVPLRPPCPTIGSFQNPNVFTRLDQGWYAYQVFRLGALRRLARLAARVCDRILFVSHDSARWIGDDIGLPETRRAVIHHGVDPARFAEAPGGPPLPRPYILSVSPVYRYKNFVRLIEAWIALARRREQVPDLAIVGGDLDPDYTRRMRDARAAAGDLAERIHLVGAVPYGEIGRWYRSARLFAFPSYLETFGLPLLEAMAAGLPMLVGDIAISREVAGDAARYVDPHDTGAMIRALEELLSDEALRRRLAERARRRAGEFSWEECARRHLALFDEVAEERGR